MGSAAATLRSMPAFRQMRRLRQPDPGPPPLHVGNFLQARGNVDLPDRAVRLAGGKPPADVEHLPISRAGAGDVVGTQPQIAQRVQAGGEVLLPGRVVRLAGGGSTADSERLVVIASRRLDLADRQAQFAFCAQPRGQLMARPGSPARPAPTDGEGETRGRL